MFLYGKMSHDLEKYSEGRTRLFDFTVLQVAFTNTQKMNFDYIIL
jgi:hypothetical protein